MARYGMERHLVVTYGMERHDAPGGHMWKGETSCGPIQDGETPGGHMWNKETLDGQIWEGETPSGRRRDI